MREFLSNVKLTGLNERSEERGLGGLRAYLPAPRIDPAAVLGSGGNTLLDIIPLLHNTIA